MRCDSLRLQGLPARALARGAALLVAAIGLAATGAAQPTGGVPPAQSAERVDFEELGRAFLAGEFGRKAELDQVSLERLVQTHCARARLGSFELAMPTRFLKDSKLARLYTQIAVRLLDLQEHLVAWMQPPPELSAQITADAATLRSWVESWKSNKLARIKGDGDLYVEFEAPADVVAARDRLHAALGDVETLGVAPQYVDGVTLVLCPTRRDFMELAGFLGLLDPSWRPANWNEGTSQWTQVWCGPVLALALEYAPWTGFDPNFAAGLDPERLDKGGLMQHVLNQAARGLIFRWFNRPRQVTFERALAAQAVIELEGRIMILDGEGGISSSGATTLPYERFVPGGLSEGGVLPAIPAAPFDMLLEGQWRKGRGSDYFVEALREGQSDGARRAAKLRENPLRKDPTAHFSIDSDRSGAKHVVTAPFLGSPGARQAYPPPEFLNDYRQFYKSYQTGFLHWLRTVGVDGEEDARAARFAEALKLLGAAEGALELDQVFEQAYGLPLSAADPDEDSLEWRFLRWLPETK
jgi:hypothetical protein